MNFRSKDLILIRPEIKKKIFSDSMGIKERFQNETLRPILKLQDPLFKEVFINYIEMRKGLFYLLSLSKKLDYIKSSLIKDQKFRNSIKGMVIGHFTVSEYHIYKKYSSELNKRIINMAVERLKDQVQLFEAPLK